MLLIEDRCNPIVFKEGEFVCFLDVSKEEANEYCRNLWEDPKNNYAYDWHYVGGKVRVIRLDKNHPSYVNY